MIIVSDSKTKMATSLVEQNHEQLASIIGQPSQQLQNKQHKQQTTQQVRHQQSKLPQVMKDGGPDDLDTSEDEDH